MDRYSHLDAIIALADLPSQFPIPQIPPGVTMWISRGNPRLITHVTSNRFDGPAKTYEVSCEFRLNCRAGDDILQLNPQPYILPNGHIDVDLFNAEYYRFFRVRQNRTIRRWVSRLDSPLGVFCIIYNGFLLAKRLCNESSNLSTWESKSRYCV